MRSLSLMLIVVATGASGQTLDYSHWHRADYLGAMETLRTTYPSLVRTMDLPGTTAGGNRIRVLKISTTPDADDPAKGDVVLVGAHHAREWISVETALYLADRLLDDRASDPQLAADLDRLQVWVIPVLNVDGYAYTQLATDPDPTDGTTPLDWRKNRQPNGDGSFGVDPNRNYGFQFGLAGTDPVDGRSINVSATPSDSTYFGASAFATAEAAAIRDFLQARQNLRLLVTYHSYSAMWLRPWSYTGADPPGELFLRAIGDRSRAQIQAVHGIPYVDDISYHSSGEATDWIWNTFRVAAFTPEVRPQNCVLVPYGTACSAIPGQVGGFNPAEAQILPNNEEQFPPARALIRDAARTELWIKDHPDDDGSEPSARATPGGGWTRPFWESPDIRTEPAELRGGETARLFVRVRNATGMARTGVQLHVFYTDPRVALEFPSPTSVLIGQQTGLTVPPGGREFEFAWTIPNTLNAWGEPHWCVGAIVMHENDMPLSSQIQKTSNIGGRNFETVVTSLAASSLVMVAADNNTGVAAELEVRPDPDLLERGWRIEPVFGEFLRARTESTRRKALLLDVKGPVIEPGQSVLIPVRIVPPPGTPPGTDIPVRLDGVLRPLIAGPRPALGNGFTYRVRVAP